MNFGDTWPVGHQSGGPAVTTPSPTAWQQLRKQVTGRYDRLLRDAGSAEQLAQAAALRDVLAAMDVLDGTS